MTAVSQQSIAPAGIVPAYAAVASTDTIASVTQDERLFLHVKNGGGGSITVSIAPVAPTSVRVSGVGVVAVPSISVAVAAGAEKMIGPIPSAYIDGTGTVTVGYSGTTSVTAAAFRLPASSN